MATLYLVSTPIGNLSDLTRRAEQVLGSVDRVLAEDTRRTRVLLDHIGVSSELVSLHEHNEAARTERILGWLSSGEELALVSDAGTPLVSDPGARLVEAVAGAGHRIVPIPGPSAVLAALVASGIPWERFLFLGFPPRKGRERDEVLERIASASETVVLFESPNRLGALLDDLRELCGGTRRVAVGRELTKVHEEFVRGTIGEVAGHFAGRPPRGEVTLVVAPGEPVAEKEAVDEAAGEALGRALLDEGLRPSQAAREIAGRLGISRNRAYELIHRLDGDGR